MNIWHLNKRTQVVVHLTHQGQERWKDVAALVHAHARLVRELPADDARRAWQESRDMGAIYLRFQQASAKHRVIDIQPTISLPHANPPVLGRFTLSNKVLARRGVITCRMLN